MLPLRAKYLQILAATLVASIFFAGLALSAPAGNRAPNKSKSNKPVNDPAFHKELLTVAADYKNYGKVDDETRWGSPLCSAIVLHPSRARLSASKDEANHGRKVYFLFAKNRSEYFRNEPPKVGQVVVKEAWHSAVEGAAQDTNKPVASETPMGLFVVMKLAPETPNSDKGWVYGTIAPDGKTVTSAGRVQSCMECHTPAPNERLFGLTK